MRQACDAQDVAFALLVDVIARLNLFQRRLDIGRAWLVPDVPERGVFRAQLPEREGLYAHRACGAHFVHGRDAIQHPDLMANVLVLIVVGEMRVQFVTGERHTRLRIAGLLPALLHADGADVDYFLRGMSLGIRQRHGPVVAVVAQRTDQALLGHDLQHLLEVVFKPILGSDRSRQRCVLVLVVVHQHDPVRVRRLKCKHLLISTDRHVDVEPQVLGGKIRIELSHKCLIPGLGIVWNLLKVQRYAVIFGVCFEKFIQLQPQAMPRAGIVQHGTDHRVPIVGHDVVVINQRKDFRIFVRIGNRLMHIVVRIDTVDGPVGIDDAIGVRRCKRHGTEQRAGRIVHVKPHRKEHIDLMDVLLQR